MVSGGSGLWLLRYLIASLAALIPSLVINVISPGMYKSLPLKYFEKSAMILAYAFGCVRAKFSSATTSFSSCEGSPDPFLAEFCA